MENVEFICPECGKHQLEEVMLNSKVFTKIVNIAIENNVAIHTIGISHGARDGDIECYRCFNCEYILKYNDEHWGPTIVCDTISLAIWFKQNKG
ncbi:unnamed protein product [marine sediment metagenome]|uniref:Uncharacterized protein n=1 Tax=marine sediment metagenome TaxID=412755 RepID=X1A3T4_9ZZZZ